MTATSETQQRDLNLVASRLWVIAIPALAGILLVVVPSQSGWTRGIGVTILVSLAAMLAGGVVGFLFGIPKSGQAVRKQNDSPEPEHGAPAPADATGLRRNTNIEEISDWLTKIIVGLGIYELKEIPSHAGRLARFLAEAYGPPARYSDGVIGVVVAILFAATGFLAGYLLTVLFMPGALQRADPTVRRKQELEQDAVAARQIGNVVDPADQASQANIRRQVFDLADRYERERASRLPGPERTAVLEEITREMRKLALAAYPLLDELTPSDSPGRRLAAIAFLSIRPSDPYLEWLGRRLPLEVPFLKYQIAVALDRAATSPEIQALEALRKAIAAGRSHLEAEHRANTDEYRMLASAERKAAARA